MKSTSFDEAKALLVVMSYRELIELKVELLSELSNRQRQKDSKISGWRYSNGSYIKSEQHILWYFIKDDK